MKFTWFNLMPWPYLPDDFREKNRSVWVDIDSRLFDPAKGHEVYNNHLDLLEYASTLGFDGIGCGGMHMPRGRHHSCKPLGICIDTRLRWHRLQRASPERLRP